MVHAIRVLVLKHPREIRYLNFRGSVEQNFDDTLIIQRIAIGTGWTNVIL